MVGTGKLGTPFTRHSSEVKIRRFLAMSFLIFQPCITRRLELAVACDSYLFSQDCDAISAVKAGKLRFSKPNKYWIETTQRRYVPCVGDTVLGIVVDARADNFLVDIRGPTVAFLPVLAFEGGTRRNIPKFEPGTLLYVRVVKANAGMNPELSCTDASGKAAEFGALKEGYMFESTSGLARMLLSSPTCPVLDVLGKKLRFEIAVGLNGRVWVNSESPSVTILVANAMMKSESLGGAQQRIMAEKLLQRVH